MKNMKYVEAVAMFMICLVIALPIYASGVYAEINNVEAYGSSGIPNVVKQDYNMVVKAELSGSVDKDDVKLVHSSLLSTNFDSCVSTNSTTTCSVNIIKGVNSEVELCPQANLNIEQYAGSPILVDRESVLVKCDAKPPTISMSLSPSTTSGNSVTLSYTITDPTDSTTGCSGIQKLEFYTNDLSSPATLEVGSTSCSYTGSTQIPVSSYSDGIVPVYIKAYDLVGQSSITNSSFILDKSGPDATAEVTIKDQNGRVIDFFTPQTVYLDVTLDITDLTGITSYNLDYSDLTGSSPACSGSGTQIQCKWTNLQIYMESYQLSKTIKLTGVDTLGNNVSRDISVTGEITSDANPPTVSMSEITIDTIDGSVMSWFRPGEMKMNFSALIYDDVSGVESISGDFSNINVISGSTPACTLSGSTYNCVWSDLRFNMDSASYSKEVSVISIDKAGNEGRGTKTASATHRADTSSPTTSNFIIVNSFGTNITGWIGDEIITSRIYLDITEKGSGLEKVEANLININPSYTSPVAGSCQQTSGQEQTTAQPSGIYQEYVSTSANITLPELTYRCTWDVILHFNQSGAPLNVQFSFNSTDNSLNSLISSYSNSFYVDVNPPIPTLIGTSRYYNGIYYVGTSENDYFSSISDSGVGMDGAQAYLDLTEVGYEPNKQAYNCSSGYCHWTTLGCESVSEGVHTLYLTTDTQDDLGNTIITRFSGNVTLDKTRPVLNSINVTAVASTTQLYQDYIQTGNALYIVAEITEDISLLSATADLSNFISNEHADLADNCVQNPSTSDSDPTTWTCEWATDEIDINQYNKANIYLNFTDVAGNELIVAHEIEVFEALTGDVSYWYDIIGTSSPSAIDRRIVTLYTPSMWFPVGLQSEEGLPASQRWPLEVSVESCGSVTVTVNSSTNATSSTVSGVNYLSSSNGNMPTLNNPNTDMATSLPYQMYSQYELEQSAPNSTNSINITCTLKIRTLIDQTKISPYEYENFTVSINYYNNPLGQLDSNVQDEIEDVQGSWLVEAEWIGQIAEILETAQQICQLVQNIYRLAEILGIAGDALKTVPVTNAGGRAIAGVAGVLGNTVQTTWQSYVNGICKLLNCQLFYGADWGGGGNIGTANNWLANYGRGLERYSDFFNPEDSLILSIIFLCIPGVLYNLQKARLIECGYINCLASTANGMPLQMCVIQRDYAWCSYVYGQIFNMLPFASIINQLADNIRLMLQQPAQMVSVGLSAVCTIQCPGKESCTACLWIEGIGLVLDVLCDFGIGSDHCESFWEDTTLDDSACETALDV